MGIQKFPTIQRVIFPGHIIVARARKFALRCRRLFQRTVAVTLVFEAQFVAQLTKGQEAVRMSLAGEAAAGSRHSAALVPDYYNLQLGPTSWNIEPSLDMELNDNIAFDSVHPQSDFILRPKLSSRMVWNVSEANALDLALGAGYSAYVFHPEYDRFFITPGSELAFDLYAGDFWINFHERLAIAANGCQDPTVVGTADYSQLQSAAGMNVLWDLNKLTLKLGYDHANYTELTGNAGVPSGESDIFALSSGYQVGSVNVVGLEAGGGLLSYDGDNAAIQEATDWNIGVFLNTRLSQYIALNAAAGYTVYTPRKMTAEISSTDYTGIYARLNLNHRVNQHLDYSLNASRAINFAFFEGTIDLYTVALEARWHCFQKIGLATSFVFEHGSQVLVGNETFDRFGPGVMLERSLGKKVTGNLRYQYYQRQSDVAGGDYAVNIVTLSVGVRL